MKVTTLIITFVLLTAYYSIAQPAETNRQAERFSPEELVGYTLFLVSETKLIKEYSFFEDGLVDVSSGKTNQSEGWGYLGGWASRWQLDSQGRLKILIPLGGGGYELWTKLWVKDDLIEVEISTRDVNPKPSQEEYIIEQENDSVVRNNYLTDKFTMEELSGSSMIYNAVYTYTFKSDGSGTKSVDPQQDIILEEDDRKFQWTVDKEGILKIFMNSDTIYYWRKLTHENDKIMVEKTIFYSPQPRREIYRKGIR